MQTDCRYVYVAVNVRGQRTEVAKLFAEDDFPGTRARACAAARAEVDKYRPFIMVEVVSGDGGRGVVCDQFPGTLAY